MDVGVDTWQELVGSDGYQIFVDLKKTLQYQTEKES